MEPISFTLVTVTLLALAGFLGSVDLRIARWWKHRGKKLLGYEEEEVVEEEEEVEPQLPPDAELKTNLSFGQICEQIEPEISFSTGKVHDGDNIVGRRFVERVYMGKRPTGREIVVGQKQVGERKVGEEISHYIKVGERQIGWKQDGTRPVEKPIPGGEPFFRPIRDPSEITMMLPTDRAVDGMLGFIGALTGEAKVRSFIHQVPHIVPDMEDIMEPVMRDVMEPVYEDVMGPEMEDYWEDKYDDILEPRYREVESVLYLLVDRSGSLVSLEWVTRYWRGILRFAVETARKSNARIMLRYFTSVPWDLQIGATDQEVEAILSDILYADPRGGTDITTALYTAVEDLEGDQYDEATVMIVSDGLDSNLDYHAADIVLRYMDAGVNLHAVMLTSENEGLRMCADIYQCIPNEGEMYETIYRSIN